MCEALQFGLKATDSIFRTCLDPNFLRSPANQGAGQPNRSEKRPPQNQKSPTPKIGQKKSPAFTNTWRGDCSNGGRCGHGSGRGSAKL